MASSTNRLAPVSMATPDVLAPRYWFEMIRIDTRTRSAQMIQIATGWDRPARQFIKDLVCKSISSFVCHSSIAMLVNGFQPQPATAHRFWQHLGKQLVGRVHAAPRLLCFFWRSATKDAIPDLISSTHSSKIASETTGADSFTHVIFLEQKKSADS